MSRIARYEFIGDWRVFTLLLALELISAIVFLPLLIGSIPILIVYLLLTIIKIEEEIESPNEFIAGYKVGRFRK